MPGIFESLASDPARMRRVSFREKEGRWYEITRLGGAVSCRPFTAVDYWRLNIPTDSATR